MEVHHHSHAHGKKTWKSYFWEFLMLFLAVFCGFFAEYQLEHKIEKDREKVYIQSMIEDLMIDTANLNASINNFILNDKHFDTITLLYHELPMHYNASLRNSLHKIIGYKDFFPSDKTLQQLKNAGAMRLIRSKKAADGIMTYDARLKEYEKSLKVLDDVFTKMHDMSMQVLDAANAEKDAQTIGLEKMEKNSNNYLYIQDKAVLGNYYNRIITYRLLRNIVIKRMHILKDNASNLITTLQSEYHMNN
ncbi:MAG: hypothetical protein ACOVNY_01555 [Chitinophagaceae bacterium]